MELQVIEIRGRGIFSSRGGWGVVRCCGCGKCVIVPLFIIIFQNYIRVLSRYALLLPFHARACLIFQPLFFVKTGFCITMIASQRA